MIYRSKILLGACLALSLAACSADTAMAPGGVTVTLADHVDNVSADPDDNFIELRVTGGDETFALDMMLLTWEVAGETATAMNYELTEDADGDGRFGAGDTLTGVEPGLDRVGPGDVGTTYLVTFYEELEPGRVRTIFTGDWVAE